MKTLSALTLVLFTASSGSALQDTGGLGWHPPEGATLRRELVTKQLLVTESMTFVEGDQTTVSQRVFDVVSTTTLRVSDQLQACGDARPLRLRRFYDEVSVAVRSEVSGGRQQTRGLDISGKSAFQGMSVMFSWNDEDQDYGRYYDGLEGREESLPGLSEDLGVRSFLPAQPAAEGSEWKLEPSVLADLFAAGGDLSLDFQSEKDPLVARSLEQGIGANLHLAFAGQATGEVNARWARTQEVEGRKLAVIALEFEVALKSDLTELVNTTRAINEIAAGQETTQALLSVDLKGSGELRWDLAAGCLFDTDGLRADERLRFEKTVEMKRGDELMRSGQVLVMTGTLLQESSVTVEP